MCSIIRIVVSVLMFWLWSLDISECAPTDVQLSPQDDLRVDQSPSIDTRASECSTQFQECVNKHFGYFNNFHENYTSGSTIFVDEESVNQMCQLADSLPQCLENTRVVCESDTYWGSQRAHYYTDLKEYVCSHTGRIVFLRTNGSQCGQQDIINRLQSQCQISAQKTFNLEKQTKGDRFKQTSHCSYVQRHRQCTVDAIKQTCGQALAELMSRIDQAINGERYAYEKTLHGC